MPVKPSDDDSLTPGVRCTVSDAASNLKRIEGLNYLIAQRKLWQIERDGLGIVLVAGGVAEDDEVTDGPQDSGHDGLGCARQPPRRRPCPELSQKALSISTLPRTLAGSRASRSRDAIDEPREFVASCPRRGGVRGGSLPRKRFPAPPSGHQLRAYAVCLERCRPVLPGQPRSNDALFGHGHLKSEQFRCLLSWPCIAVWASHFLPPNVQYTSPEASCDQYNVHSGSTRATLGRAVYLSAPHVRMKKIWAATKLNFTLRVNVY